MTASVLLITYLTDLFEAAVSMQIFFSGSDASIQPAWGLVAESVKDALGEEHRTVALYPKRVVASTEASVRY